jgi:hypothetical protein
MLAGGRPPGRRGFVVNKYLPANLLEKMEDPPALLARANSNCRETEDRSLELPTDCMHAC